MQSGFCQRDEEEKYAFSAKFAEKRLPFFYLFVVYSHLICQISIESVRKIVICSLNVLMIVMYLKFCSIL